jgi:hypothetical protein
MAPRSFQPYHTAAESRIAWSGGTQGPVLKSPEIVNQLWLARSKAKEVDLAPGATAQVTLPALD